MAKLLTIDKDILKIIYPGITDKQLDIEYDIYNGITISSKARNRYPIEEEEIDELIEKQSLIKILYAMDGNKIYNDFNVSENVISYLNSLSEPMKRIKVKKLQKITNNEINKISNIENSLKTKHSSLITRKQLRTICHYIYIYPNDEKSEKLKSFLEQRDKKL